MIAASGRFDLAFTCTDSTGAPVAPTGTPTGTLVKNGTDLGTTVTVTMSTAQGIASCTIPSDAANGDRFYLRISAVVSAVTYVLSGPVETVSNSASQTGDSFARIGAAGAGLTALGDTRLAYLDAYISAINNLSSLCNLLGPPLLEIPDSGSSVYIFTMAVKDIEGKMVALDASPSIVATNASGTSRSGNLSAVSNPSTGRYTFTYTVASTDTQESIRIVATGAVSGEARYAEWIGVVVDYAAYTMLAAIKTKTDQLTFTTANVVDASPTPAANIRTAVGLASANLDTQLDTLPTAAESATAVWAAGTRTLTSSGSGSVEVLSFDDAALDQLRGVEFIGPQAVYGEAKQIVAGDDYSGSRAIVFASDAIPDLSAASSITFTVRATDRAHTLAFSTTSVAYTTGQLAVTLTEAQTRIDPGMYDYDIEAVVGGLKQTVIGPKARLVVLEDQTR